jgi:hypothetical protein
MRSTEVGLRLFTVNKVRAPAPSVALITAVMSEAFLPAGGRALAEVVFTEVVSMVAEGVVDRTVVSGIYRGFKNGEEYHVAHFFKC